MVGRARHAAQSSLATLQSQLPARPHSTRNNSKPLAMVGDKNLASVSQAVEFCAANPEILPRAIDIAKTTRKAEARIEEKLFVLCGFV